MASRPSIVRRREAERHHPDHLGHRGDHLRRHGLDRARHLAGLPEGRLRLRHRRPGHAQGRRLSPPARSSTASRCGSCASTTSTTTSSLPLDVLYGYKTLRAQLACPPGQQLADPHRPASGLCRGRQGAIPVLKAAASSRTSSSRSATPTSPPRAPRCCARRWTRAPTRSCSSTTTSAWPPEDLLTLIETPGRRRRRLYRFKKDDEEYMGPGPWPRRSPDRRERRPGRHPGPDEPSASPPAS
jgi:hypothetical protein